MLKDAGNRYQTIGSSTMGRPSKSGHRWLTPLGWGYVALIASWLVLRALAFDRLWWLALLNTFALALFLPLVALLPLALWRRQTRLLLALALPLVAFVWLFGDVLLPPLAPPATASPAITAMSFNVLWSNQDYPRIAQAIRAADPDIVALQELRPGHRQAIDAELGGDYPYRAVHPVDPSVGLLSRFPIEAATPLADPPFPRALLVRVRVSDRPLTVVAAHLTPTNMLDHGLARVPGTVAERYASRTDQVEALLVAVGAAEQPVIILCDCNLTDTSEAHARLRTGLTDSFAAAGWGLRRTMLAPGLSLPFERLDYIWYTAELRAVEAVVGQAGGSDHLPVVARLAWR
jgi:endonuclease/exonuclease/phosphatase (EEP) superfamily protein YafD